MEANISLTCLDNAWKACKKEWYHSKQRRNKCSSQKMHELNSILVSPCINRCLVQNMRDKTRNFFFLLPLNEGFSSREDVRKSISVVNDALLPLYVTIQKKINGSKEEPLEAILTKGSIRFNCKKSRSFALSSLQR